MGPWDSAQDTLLAWERPWTEACVTMTDDPWVNGVLPRKFIELVGVALNAACTNLDPDGTRRHIRAALADGATREEIVTILKMASVMSIHSCSLGAPILLEEAKSAGATVREIMEVLKLCVVQGVQACNLGIPILADELARAAGPDL